jgi:hypothetical protein
MIDGLKVQMTAAELASRLQARIQWNERTAKQYEEELLKDEADREDPLRPEHMIAHEVQEHRARAGTLTLLRDHLVPGEIYLLGERDLQFADLVPEFSMECVMPPRFEPGVDAP